MSSVKMVGSLKSYSNQGNILLDATFSSSGTTVLNEAVTKTAQFTGIVEVLLDFGARLDVR